MTLKLPKPNLGWLIPILSETLGIGLFLLDPLPLQVLRNTVFDQYQRWNPRTYQQTPVRIIDIDDESLSRLGQWPWPRTRMPSSWENYSPRRLRPCPRMLRSRHSF